MALKRTPLFNLYKDRAKTVDFGGWEMPVSYSGIKAEHFAVRKAAGLFDVSHMGELKVDGPDALHNLQRLLTNDVANMKDNQAQYNAMCTEQGGTVDDLIVYRRSEHSFMLVLNAANIESDIEWIQSHVEGDVVLENVSAQTALLAVQGPKAVEVLQTLTNVALDEIRPFHFQENVTIGSASVFTSRTGYTGEDGFELYVSAEEAGSLWQDILKAGESFGLLPCGLGARDTLRFEAKLALYGQELTRTISPIEAGIGFAVKVDKDVPFIGQDILKQQKREGAPRKLVGIEMVGKGIPRNGYDVYFEGENIGFVTSGTQSPTYGINVGLALIEKRYSELGTELDVDIRGKRVRAKIVKTPFYKRKS